MSETEPSFEEAAAAKEVLLAWIGEVGYMDLTDCHDRKKAMLYAALTQDFFLET